MKPKNKLLLPDEEPLPMNLRALTGLALIVIAVALLAIGGFMVGPKTGCVITGIAVFRAAMFIGGGRD